MPSLITLATGSIANLASAATVAASSFTMTLQSPQQLLDKIDFSEYDRLREYYSPDIDQAAEPTYAEPSPVARIDVEHMEAAPSQAQQQGQPQSSSLPRLIRGRVQRFGDNVDTDSIAPTEICLGSPSPEQLGRGAFCHTRPEVYERAQAGATILVAGTAFGTGSSREQAPKALLAAGIRAVVARSFAFIYARNQANSGLLGIKVRDDRFYELALEGVEVEIDVEGRAVVCGGERFGFRLDPIEERLIAAGGLLKMYDLHGNALFKYLQDAVTTVNSPRSESLEDMVVSKTNGKLDW